VAALRERILRAESGRQAATAYKAYFLRLGRGSLKDITKDGDTGIALQAGWEAHLRPVRRDPPIRNRADDVYDPAGLKTFVAFLKDRTKAPVPDWWADGLTEVDLFPGRHHAFAETSLKRGGPKVRMATSGHVVPEMAAADERGQTLVYASGGWAVEIPKGTFDDRFFGGLFGVIGVERSVVAGYDPGGGSAYRLAGFRGAGGKPTWTAQVWATGRRFGNGNACHAVELAVDRDAVYVFGMESHGAYIEAFDAATGKVQFRFCTSYWSEQSEAWGLK
jgi:hypothetical protein